MSGCPQTCATRILIQVFSPPSAEILQPASFHITIREQKHFLSETDKLSWLERHVLTYISDFWVWISLVQTIQNHKAEKNKY